MRKLAEFPVLEPANEAAWCAFGVHILSALFGGQKDYIGSMSYFNRSF